MPDARADLAALTRRPGPGPHLASVAVDGELITTLADLPPLRDRLLFVGLNPSPVSIAAGHYHQGRLGQLFWRRLIAAGILPDATPVETADDALVAAGHGITDLIKKPTARELATRLELRAGIGPLWQKVAIWRPAAVVFIDKRAAEAAAGRQLGERWGQLHGVALAARPCLLMPSASSPSAEVARALAFLGTIAAFLSRAMPEPASPPRLDA